MSNLFPRHATDANTSHQIYRMIKPKIVLLIFVSGKIVLTGAKVREEIYQAFEMIYPVLNGMYCILPQASSKLTNLDFRKV